MKVFEVLQDTNAELRVANALKNFNWQYEFDENLDHINEGHEALASLENMVFQFWKVNPSKAIELWNRYDPFADTSKSVIPAFIYRLQNQE